MTFSKYFTLNVITIDNSRSLTHGGAIDRGKLLILMAITLYSYSVPYIILLILPLMQGEMQSSYSKRAYSYIDQRLLAPSWRRPS